MPERDAERGCVHFIFRQFKFPGAHVLVREELDFLEAHDLRSHQHVAMHPRCRSCDGLFCGDFQHSHLGIADRIREIVNIDRLHVGLALVEVQLLDVVLLSLVDVDRLWMDGNERG